MRERDERGNQRARALLGSVAIVGLLAGAFAGCGKTNGPQNDSNTNWSTCTVDSDCDAGYRCSSRGRCVQERRFAEASVASSEATGADASSATAGRDATADSRSPDEASILDRGVVLGDSRPPGADAGSAVDAAASGDADVAPHPSCAPVPPGDCQACDGIAVRADTGRCGCICGEPVPLFEDGEHCIATCPETCTDAAFTVLGTALADGFNGPLPTLDDGGSCRVSAGVNATVYRTSSCLDERFNGTAPWSVDFGFSQVVEICDPFGGCEWPITLEALENCGVLFHADYVVTEPCVTCDAESPRCVFFEMPLSPLPIDARPTRAFENCTQSLCEGTGGTWSGAGCDCGPGRSFDPATGCE